MLPSSLVKRQRVYIKRRKKGQRENVERGKKLFHGGCRRRRYPLCCHNAVTALHGSVNIKTNEATPRCTLCRLLPCSAMCLYIDSIPCHREKRIRRESSVARRSGARGRRDRQNFAGSEILLATPQVIYSEWRQIIRRY